MNGGNDFFEPQRQRIAFRVDLGGLSTQAPHRPVIAVGTPVTWRPYRDPGSVRGALRRPYRDSAAERRMPLLFVVEDVFVIKERGVIAAGQLAWQRDVSQSVSGTLNLAKRAQIALKPSHPVRASVPLPSALHSLDERPPKGGRTSPVPVPFHCSIPPWSGRCPTATNAPRTAPTAPTPAVLGSFAYWPRAEGY
jgi:hypothetical protein